MRIKAAGRQGRVLLASLALGVCGWMGAFFAPSIVHAQYACGGGPGPGEVQVGVSQGGAGVAPVPLCRRVQGQGAAPQEPLRPPSPIYMAVAMHPDVKELWAATGLMSDWGAEQLVLAACAQVMGEGCYVAEIWSGFEAMSIVEDVAGNQFARGGETEDRAKRAAIDLCKKYSSGCHHVLFISDYLRGDLRRFPEAPGTYRLYASIARPKDSAPEPWDDIAWLVSGRTGYNATQQAALDQCQRDTGMECVVRATAAQGYIARIVDDQGGLRWLNAPGLDGLEARIRALCPKGRKCRLVDTFDARRQAAMRIEISKSDAPVRGFYATARPKDAAAEKAWGRRAVVTGGKSREEVEAAALALCEKESKSSCDVNPDDHDRGVDQFMLLTRNASGESKLIFGMSPEQVRQRRDELCAKAGTQCDRGAIVDLAKPTRTLVKF